MRMVQQNPRCELQPHVPLADAFQHLDASGAQDGDTGSVDTRVRITQCDHHPRDAALGDGVSASRGAAMERARLERRVQRRPDNRQTAGSRIFSRRNLGVVLAGPLRMALPEQLTASTDDGAPHPGIVARIATCPLGLSHGQAHECLVLVQVNHDAP